MRYVSTRGGVSDIAFEDALFSGYAADGGLIVPESIPQVSLETLTRWKSLTYPEIVQEVISLFVTEEEIPKKDLKNLLTKAFSRFDIDAIIKIAKFGDLNIAELWHGPTLAFKDLAMMCVGELLEYFLAKRGKRVTVIVVTSGDTGSSAIEAVRGKENVDIIVMFPHNRISKVQELMMTTVLDDNVHVYAGDGSVDDFEIILKRIFADKEFTQQNKLCSINSINWVRIMVQIAHHIFIYLQVTEEVGSPVDIVIPTGACGNLAAATFAQKIGIPAKLVAVVNENDLVHRIVRHNDLTLGASIETLACAMDIQIPCNFGRLVWIFSGEDPIITKEIMDSFDSSNRSPLPPEIHLAMRESIRTAMLTDDDILETLKRCWIENSYLCCPHTCASVSYYYGMSRHGTRTTAGTRMKDGRPAPMVCIATASIAKFAETLNKAKIESVDMPDRIQELFGKSTKFNRLISGEDWESVIRRKIETVSSLKRR